MIAEPGMRLAVLSGLLETVGLSLDLRGRLPDLAVVDALAIGLIGQEVPTTGTGYRVPRYLYIPGVGTVVTFVDPDTFGSDKFGRTRNLPFWIQNFFEINKLAVKNNFKTKIILKKYVP